MGEASKPRVRSSSKSSALCTKEAPVPPSVKEGRITKGKPNFWAISFPLRKEVAVSAGATGISKVSINSLNC